MPEYEVLIDVLYMPNALILLGPDLGHRIEVAEVISELYGHELRDTSVLAGYRKEGYYVFPHVDEMRRCDWIMGGWDNNYLLCYVAPPDYDTSQHTLDKLMPFDRANEASLTNPYMCSNVLAYTPDRAELIERVKATYGHLLRYEDEELA